jgi:MFS family permease
MLLVHGVARAFQIPSEHALLPNIVSKENLEKAVAITSTVSNLAKTTGPLIAGLLIALTDRYIYGICIIIVLISFLAYLFLPMFKIHAPAEFGLKPFLSGIKFVAKKKILLAIILLDLFIVLLGSVEALLPIYAADILNVGPNGLGLMRGMPAIGAVITGILLSNIGPLRHCGKLLFAAFGICSLSVLVFGLSDIFWLSLIALFIYGATDMLSVNIRFTLAQTITPDAVRGRVSAIFATSTASSNQLGEFRAGTLATAVGPIGATIIGGILGLIICISGIFKFPMLWKLDKISDLRNESNEFKKE